MPAPDLDTTCSLLAEHLKRLKGCFFSVLDMVVAPFLKYTVRYEPRSRVVVLMGCLPPLAQLFLLSFESARVHADWKFAKMIPQCKKGPMLDPNSYRMLAVSGTIYRLYANVIRSMLTSWCISISKISDTQFGFYPGRVHP